MSRLCAVCILMIFTHDLAPVLFSGMALKCNLCVSKGPASPCTPSEQTCLPHITTCGHIKFRPGLLGSASIRSCMSMSTCWSYKIVENIPTVCCKTDLCN